MANTSRISKQLPNIKKSLLRRQPHIFQIEDLHHIFLKNKKNWNLPAAMNAKKFIEALVYEVVIDFCQLDFDTEWYAGYFLCSSPANYIIQHLIHKTYLSHASALELWGMADGSNRIYVNREQSMASSKALKGKLVQSAINNVFKGQQRQTAALSEFNGLEIVFIRGKFTNQLGVIEFDLKGREAIMVTDLERTLIDCVVRPAYALPAEKMIAAFRKAKDQISVTTLVDYLTELNYTYPYHQSVGFYLEKAGNYLDSEIQLFAAQNIQYDFYLDYNLDSPAYSKKWKLFYPAGLA
jgi:predicted transcriptional regulator of viral defense system